MNAPNARLLEASWGKRLLAASPVGLLLGLGALLLVARLGEGLLHPQTLVAGWYLLLGPRLSSLLDAPGPWILALAAGALLTGLVRARDRAVARSPLLALALLPCLAGWALGAGLAARVLLR